MEETMSDKKMGIAEKKRYQPPALMLLGEVDWGVGYSCSFGNLPVSICGVGVVDAFVSCRGGGSATGGGCGPGSGNSDPYDPIIP
jgi:hypothetical protein